MGRRIAELRKSRGFSQEELARLLEIPGPSLAQIELGTRNISASDLIGLSNALHISCETLLAKYSPVKV